MTTVQGRIGAAAEGLSAYQEEATEVVDIPAQLGKLFWYSGRSWKSFLLSLSLAGFIAGVCFDLLYGFLYTRIYNVEHAHYGRIYWESIVAVSLVIPLFSACAWAVSWLLLARRFKRGIFGVAIAPFEVASVHVDSMLTSDRLRALDEAMQQFFAATQQLLDEEEWASKFQFRLLPARVRVRNKTEAAKRFQSLNATLLIWGQLIQEDVLRMRLRLTGVDLDMSITGPASPFYTSNSLKLWSLLAAVMSLKKRGACAGAIELVDLAVKPAKEIDALVTDRNKADVGPTEKLLQGIRADLETPPHAPAGLI